MKINYLGSRHNQDYIRLIDLNTSNSQDIKINNNDNSSSKSWK